MYAFFGAGIGNNPTGFWGRATQQGLYLTSLEHIWAELGRKVALSLAPDPCCSFDQLHSVPGRRLKQEDLVPVVTWLLSLLC